MAEFENVVCETRYCPECGTEIFCRIEPHGELIFFLTEDLGQPITICPECTFALEGIGDETTEQPAGRSTKKPALVRQKAANEDVLESLLDKNPNTFKSRAEADRVFKAVKQVLIDLLADGKDVFVPGLGTFKVRSQKARRGQNPQTGEEIHIPERKVVTFSAATNLKRQVNS